MPTVLQRKLNSNLLASLQLQRSTLCAVTLSHLTTLLCGTDCLVTLGMSFKLLFFYLQAQISQKPSFSLPSARAVISTNLLPLTVLDLSMSDEPFSRKGHLTLESHKEKT